MVEFWTCVGLACFDKEFFEGLRSEDNKKAEQTIRDQMFRLSCSEFKELRKMVGDTRIATKMREMQALEREVWGRWPCPHKPLPCPE
jgi:hypothetical protein